jgi:hypothetical protein
MHNLGFRYVITLRLEDENQVQFVTYSVVADTYSDAVDETFELFLEGYDADQFGHVDIYSWSWTNA